MKATESALRLEPVLGKAWELLLRLAGGVPRLVLLLLVFIGLYLLLRLLVVRTEKAVQAALDRRDGLPGEQNKRIRTLLRLAQRVLLTAFWALAAVILLGQVGVDIGPLLAAAGILGLAVSFGAQSLVKDVISGIFILAEDQVRIGDVAVVNGTGGVVEGLNLRTIVLRDVAGAVHVFPNGAVTTLANLTKDWSAAVFTVRVPLREEVDRVIGIVRRVAEGLAGDEEFSGRILAPAEIWGLDQIDDSALVIQGRIRTRPGEHWAVRRELNRRIKQAFDAEGIAFAVPSRAVTLVQPAPPPPAAGGTQAK